VSGQRRRSPGTRQRAWHRRGNDAVLVLDCKTEPRRRDLVSHSGYIMAISAPRSSPELALRLSKLIRNSPEFWLNAQRAVDLWDAAGAIRDDIESIKPLTVT